MLLLQHLFLNISSMYAIQQPFFSLPCLKKTSQNTVTGFQCYIIGSFRVMMWTINPAMIHIHKLNVLSIFAIICYSKNITNKYIDSTHNNFLWNHWNKEKNYKQCILYIHMHTEKNIHNIWLLREFLSRTYYPLFLSKTFSESSRIHFYTC